MIHVLGFLDLILHKKELIKKICIDAYAKPTNSFIYVLSSSCYPENNINKVLKGIALKFRRIYDLDEKCDILSSVCKSYSERKVKY